MPKFSQFTPDQIEHAITSRDMGKTWGEIAGELGGLQNTIRSACVTAATHNLRYADILRKTSNLNPHKSSRQKFIHALAGDSNGSLKFAPFPETSDNELMGTPPLSRSALNKVETDGRGNIAKRKPIRASIGAISIPDIRINNGHHA